MNSVRLFERLYGRNLIVGGLAIGLGIFAAAYFGSARLDGVLSLHFVKDVNASVLFSDMLVNLITLILVFGGALFLITKRMPRLIDLIPQLLWAQWPLIPLSLLSFLFDFQQLSSVSQEGPMSAETLDMISSPGFWLSTLILIAGIIVQVHFLYGLFKVDSGLKGPKLNWSFTISLIISLVISIYTISTLN